MKTSMSLLVLAALLTFGALPAQAQQTQPAPSPTQSPATNDVSANAQQFVNLMATGDYAAARQMYEATNTTVTPETLRQTWQDIVSITGPFQQQTGVRTLPLENPEGGTMAIVTAQFENARRDLYITFNQAASVVSLDIVEAQ